MKGLISVKHYYEPTWAKINDLGQIFIAVNAQILKTKQPIWSHCWAQKSTRKNLHDASQDSSAQR